MIADRTAAAWFASLEALCRTAPGGWYAECGTSRAATTGSRIPALNSAYGVTLDPDPASLDEMALAVRARDVPWSISVRGPATYPIVGLALRHGLRECEESPVLGCPAGDVVFRDPAAAPGAIRRVRAAEWHVYTDVLAQAFEASAEVFGTMMAGEVLDHPAFAGYLAVESGRPVGTGLGMPADGVIGVFNVGVIPSHRGRGIGRAITERILADAFAAGADTAYLHSSAMGRPLYESMGFRHLETRTVFTAR
ncbi:GNAT family N-acetyltransferase [Actinoplanes sp. NPDC020271]|uniref:GNAT family N-acetyltransferase n=1 Tax=Actinoplanes sp. NPDC020271 TaxID=3363896 RepID=UPI00379C51EC